MIKNTFRLALLATLTPAALPAIFLPSSAFGQEVAPETAVAPAKVERVLLLTVEGAHALDFSRYVKAKPKSALARLTARGTTFTNARTPVSDSTPGLVALVAGATPNSSGAPYSPWWNRRLSPAASDCTSRGVLVTIDDKYNIDPKSEESGGGIDVNKLPRDPDNGCSPVWPRHMLKVNTIFEVVKKSGGRTAWFDQHIAYNELISGPDGQMIDDSYSLDGSVARYANSYGRLTGQDDKRVAALINQINGLDRTGRSQVGVPALFGAGFITFNAVQKTAGYADNEAKPTPELLKALDYVDSSIGAIVDALVERGLYDSTLIVISAKHGQAPIDNSARRMVDPAIIPGIVNGVAPDLLAQATMDTGAYLWLHDQSRTAEVVEALRNARFEAGISEIYAGESLKLFFPDPAVDPTAPDIVIQPELGVIFAESGSAKKAEHGGLSRDDVNVPLILSYPGGRGETVKTPVSTTQVAPTILLALGLDPRALRAVEIEKVHALPGF